MANQDFPEFMQLFKLDDSADSTKPTMCTFPDDVFGIKWIKYNKKAIVSDPDLFVDIKYLPLDEFLDMMHKKDLSQSNIGSYTIIAGEGIKVYYENDKHPDYYTKAHKTTIIFDSYDVSIDDNITRAKTLAYGKMKANWTQTNGFTPSLDDDFFNILLKDAKEMAWLELRQTENLQATRQARKLKISAEKKKDRINYDNKYYYDLKYPHYGRK